MNWPGTYTLDGHEPRPCEDVLEWGRWLETNDRRVALDRIGTARVSTVFVGVDHRLWAPPPLLFETMVFGGLLDDEQVRYSTWEEAEAGHAEVCQEVRGCLAALARWVRDGVL